MANFTRKTLSGSENGKGIELNNHNVYADGGVLWNDITASSLNSSYVSNFGYAKDNFVTVQNNTGVAYRSTNLINWTQVTNLPSGQGSASNSIVEVNNMAFVLANSGKIHYSTDLVSWTTTTSDPQAQQMYDIMYHEEILNYGNKLKYYTAIGFAGVRRSTNLINWVAYTVPRSIEVYSYINRFDGKYFYNRSSSAIEVSTNLVNWVSYTVDSNSFKIKGVHVFDDKVVVLPDSEMPAHSTDLINWTVYTANYIGDTFAYGNNVFVTNNSYHSTDAINWSYTISQQNERLNYSQYIRFGNDRFFWVSDNYDNYIKFSLDKKPVLIHEYSQSPSAIYEEIYLYATNNNSSSAKVFIKIDNEKNVGDELVVNLDANSGLNVVLPGTILKNGEYRVEAYSDKPSGVNIFGHVNVVS